MDRELETSDAARLASTDMESGVLHLRGIVNSADLYTAMTVLEECRALSDNDLEATTLWMARCILEKLVDDVSFIEALQAQENGRMV